MTTSLAAQLSQIAATSTHQLNLKSQRAAHSQSLIFEKKVAASQSFDTIYQISYDGFQELCALDSRFTKFQRSIFSEQSKAEDRLEMTAAQNKELDHILEEFLALVGARLLLTPAVKAVDWLVRRFRYVAFLSFKTNLQLTAFTEESTNTIAHFYYSRFFRTTRRPCF